MDEPILTNANGDRPEKKSYTNAEQVLCFGQGAYFLTTGMWPLVSMRTFEAVTGPKIDKWLVKTVGVLVSAIGASLMIAARSPRVSPEARFLAIASSGGLAAVDIIYVAKGRLAPVYLLDAAGEIALLQAWKSVPR